MAFLCPRRSKLAGSNLAAAPAGSCSYNLGTSNALFTTSGVTGAVSIQLYVKITGSAGLGVPIFGNSYVTDKPWGIYLGPTQVYSAEYGGPVYPYVAGAPNPTDGNWHRIVLSGNTLYVDGVAAATGVSNYLSKASDLWIGWKTGQFICCGMAGTLAVANPQVFSAAVSSADITSGNPTAPQISVTFTLQGAPSLTCSAPPPPPSPSCGIARASNVYNGCGYTYQSLANCQNQCQQFGGSCNAVPFIPAEGTFATTAGGSCGIARGQAVYNGCGYVYQAQGNWQQQCGSGGNTTQFIPKE